MKELTQVIDGKLCLSSLAMEEVFGVTRSALARWPKQGCPKVAPGWWPLAEVIAWRGLGNTRKTDDEDGLSDLALKLKYEAKWKQQQTEGLELKNAIARGEFIARDEIVSTLSKHNTVIKRSLQGLSRKIVTEVGPFVDPITARRIESQTAEVISGALTQMSTGDAYVPSKRREIRG